MKRVGTDELAILICSGGGRHLGLGGALNTKMILFMKLRENAKPNTVHVVHKLSCE